jgi:hypothetical protein
MLLSLGLAERLHSPTSHRTIAEVWSRQVRWAKLRSSRKVNLTISLAFLAPDLVKVAIEGRLPRGLGIARLCDLPAEWSAQYRALGLATPAATLPWLS